MSVADRTESLVPDVVRENDAMMVLSAMVLIYVVFAIIEVLLAPEGLVGSIASTLQQVTFLTAVYAMLVLALNLHWGYTGLFNIGVAGFMAVGVYTMGMAFNPPSANPPGLGIPHHFANALAGVGLGGPGFFLGLLVCVALGVVAAALVGALAALPALRLRADYLAIVTVAFSEIIRLVFLARDFQQFTLFTKLGFVPDVKLGTGAARGMGLPTNPVRAIYYRKPGDTEAGLTPVGDFVFYNADVLFGIRQSVVVEWTYSLVLVGFVVLFYVFLVRIGNSPFGRVLKAIREDEQVARSLGKDTRRFKVKVFMVGCGLMGLAGILWQGSRGFTSPNSFRPIVTFYVFIALIIGGSGSNTGSVLGGALFVALLFEGPLKLVNLVGKLINVQKADAPGTFAGALGGLSNLDPGPLVAYSMQNISPLRFVLLGVVLIVLIQRRPEGLLGHRKEVAASVDLAQRTSDRGSHATTGTDDATSERGDAGPGDEEPGSGDEDGRSSANGDDGADDDAGSSANGDDAGSGNGDGESGDDAGSNGNGDDDAGSGNGDGESGDGSEGGDGDE